jgi:DNA-binding LacI/PurR family transcriptional regulator
VETTTPYPDRVTIAAVARRAGVSAATVSRVLNDDPRVGSHYRRQVQKAVDELGYRPNRLARSLRKRHSATVGVVVSDIGNPHFSEAVRAIEDHAYAHDHTVLVCNTDETAAKQRAYLEAMIDERVRGVILSPSDPTDPTISKLIDLGIAVVAFDREVADLRPDAVVVDNVKGARAATNHLIGTGHTRIAFVGGRADVETGAERLDGYELAMRAADLTPRSVDGSFRTDIARQAMTELLASPERPTALIVANNLMTLGVVQALQDARISVPDDIALVAFDDPPWAALMDPPLTVMAQPVRRMATDAMDLLLERVAGRRTEPRRVVHHVELVVRESCGVRQPRWPLGSRAGPVEKSRATQAALRSDWDEAPRRV